MDGGIPRKNRRYTSHHAHDAVSLKHTIDDSCDRSYGSFLKTDIDTCPIYSGQIQEYTSLSWEWTPLHELYFISSTPLYSALYRHIQKEIPRKAELWARGSACLYIPYPPLIKTMNNIVYIPYIPRITVYILPINGIIPGPGHGTLLSYRCWTHLFLGRYVYFKRW